MTDKIFGELPIEIDPRVNKNMTHCLNCNIELKLIDIEEKSSYHGEIFKICQKCNRVYVLGE